MTFSIVIRARVAETAYVVITNLAGKDETYIEKRKQFDGDVGEKLVIILQLVNQARHMPFN